MYVSDIGQNTVAEVSPVTAGANLGWNVWEGSYRFGGGPQGVITDLPRKAPKVTYPIVEWDQLDPGLLSITHPPRLAHWSIGAPPCRRSSMVGCSSATC
jgi:hypothetical protein